MRGEKRFKKTTLNLGGYATACVANPKPDEVARLGIRVAFRLDLIKSHERGVDLNCAARGNGIAGIKDQVDEGMLDDSGLCQNHWQFRSEYLLNANPIPNQPPERLTLVLDHAVEINCLGTKGLAACGSYELWGERCRAVCGRGYLA